MSALQITYRRMWRNRPMRALLLAHFASNFGDWLAFMAMFSLAVLQWHTDVLGVGFLAMAYLLPFAVIAPLAGVFVDRWELRRLLIASDLLRAGIVCLMAFANDLPVLCVLLFLHQSVSTFFNPAQHAAIPRLVGRNDILAANALSTQASHATKILGPGIGGILVATLGTRGCLLLDAGTFLISAILLLALPRLSQKQVSPDAQSIRGDLRTALRSLRRNQRLTWMLTSLLFSICGLGAFLVALPIHARDALGLGARGMGLLLSMLGIGTFAGALLLMSRRMHWDRLRLIILGGILLTVSLLGYVHAENPVWASGMILILGTGTAILVVPGHALLQEETAAAVRGKVISIALAGLALAQVTGMGLAATLGQTHSAAHALWLAAGLTGCGALMLSAALRMLRPPLPAAAVSVPPKLQAATHAGDQQ